MNRNESNRGRGREKRRPAGDLLRPSRATARKHTVTSHSSQGQNADHVLVKDRLQANLALDKSGVCFGRNAAV